MIIEAYTALTLNNLVGPVTIEKPARYHKKFTIKLCLA